MTQQEIKEICSALISKTEYSFYENCTTCEITLDNGFNFIGHTVAPFDEEGKEEAFLDALNKLIEFENYHKKRLNQ